MMHSDRVYSYEVPLSTPQQFVVELIAALPRPMVAPAQCLRLTMLHACIRMLPDVQHVLAAKGRGEGSSRLEMQIQSMDLSPFVHSPFMT